MPVACGLSGIRGVGRRSDAPGALPESSGAVFRAPECVGSADLSERSRRQLRRRPRRGERVLILRRERVFPRGADTTARASACVAWFARGMALCSERGGKSFCALLSGLDIDPLLAIGSRGKRGCCERNQREPQGAGDGARDGSDGEIVQEDCAVFEGRGEVRCVFWEWACWR